MDQQILNVILKNTYSQAQLKRRVRVLKANLVQTFFGGKTEQPVSPAADLEWLRSLPANFYQQFNKDNVYKIFSDIEEEIAKLPCLTMYLTFEPDEATLNQLGASARKTLVMPILLLDIRLNPSLIAGTAFVWKGVLKDYSLKTQLEAKREEVGAGFKRFLR